MQSHSEWGCRDGMHNAKNRGNNLSNTIKDTSTIMRNRLPNYICREGLHMIVLVSLIVLLREFPCIHNFSHGASHPYIPIHSME